MTINYFIMALISDNNWLYMDVFPLSYCELLKSRDFIYLFVFFVSNTLQDTWCIRYSINGFPKPVTGKYLALLSSGSLMPR